MPRTDKEIEEYVKYYAQQGERNWAVNMLAQTEGKTVEEIEHIGRVERGKRGAATREYKCKYPEELLASIEADKAAGMTYKDLANKYRMPLKQINSIMNIIYQKKKKAAPPREPEAYPGQINDDEPEPVVESDVKIFLPGEEQAKPEEKKTPIELPIYGFEDCCAIIPESQQLHAPAKNLWFALRDELRSTALGMFGHGTELIAENVHIDQHAEVQVRTPDGENIILTVRKVAYDN